MNKKCLIFDASNYMFRAFYASPPMNNRAGFPTNALHFYTTMILSVIRRIKPDCIALAHEKKGPKFRHALYPEYKGGRTPPPEDLVLQFPWFRKITDALGMRAYEADGFEADDVIATLATQARNLGYDVIIASSDKDLMQLIRREDGYDRVVVLDALSKGGHAKDGGRWIGTDDVIARFNVDPCRVADVLALAGDAVDNIPGCKGIGEKTAGKLIAQYGSLENLMASRGEIKKPAQKANLDAFAPDAELSKKLVSLVYDVPVTLSEQTLNPDPGAVIEIFSALDLSKLIADVLGRDARPDPNVPKIARPGAANDAQSADLPASDADRDAPEPRADQRLLPGLEPGVNPPKMSAHRIAPDDISDVLNAGKRPTVALAIQNTDIAESCADLEKRIDVMLSAGKTFVFMPIFQTDSPQAPEMAGCAFVSADAADAFYCPLRAGQKSLFEASANDGAKRQDIVARTLCRNGIRCAVYNVKPVLQWLWTLGRSPDIASFFDLEIAAYILNPSRQKLSLQSCAAEYAGLSLPVDPDEWLGSGKKKKTPLEMPAQTRADAAAVWGRAVASCLIPVQNALTRAGMAALYGEVDLPAAEILARMEFAGIRINIDYLRDLTKTFDENLKKLDEEAHKFGDESFNINSPKSLGHFLFDTLKIVPATKKNRTHGWSTDQDTLESVDHPIAPIVLQYRVISKLRSSFAESLAECADKTTSRIHCRFNECVTATTRLSSSDPNLQNIPARTDLGRQIKRAFVPAPDCVFVSADYSQIELRVLAALSKDPALVNAYQNDIDIHALTASELFDKPIGEVSKDERQIAKSINFGIIYGMGAQKLAREVGISKAQAKQFLEKFALRFPTLSEWIAAGVKTARQTGVVFTLLGHRRIIGEFFNPSKMIQASGDRIAANSPIQGTASDIVKCAMIRLQTLFVQNNSKAKLLVQVHDELLVECPAAELEQTKKFIADAMINACDIGVPLKIDMKAGSDWADMESVSFRQ